MALKVSQLDMWSGKIQDRHGDTASVLEPLAKAKVDMQFVLARRTQEDPGKGVIFVSPIKGAEAEKAAKAAGLSPTKNVVGLSIEGDDEPGLGHKITRAIADAGVNFRGLSATVVGKRYVCRVAFDSAEDASGAKAAVEGVGKGPGKK